MVIPSRTDGRRFQFNAEPSNIFRWSSTKLNHINALVDENGRKAYVCIRISGFTIVLGSERTVNPVRVVTAKRMTIRNAGVVPPDCGSERTRSSGTRDDSTRIPMSSRAATIFLLGYVTLPLAPFHDGTQASDLL